MFQVEAMHPQTRPRPLTYTVLTEDNTQLLSNVMGRPQSELYDILKKCTLSSSLQVFWLGINRWWGIRVDGMYVYYGDLDECVYQAMRGTELNRGKP